MIRKLLTWSSCFVCLLALTTCSISYTVNQSTIDYNIIKTIKISDFPNHATLISPTLSNTLSQELKDRFSRTTRLEQVNGNADLEIEGEITGYNQTPMAVKEDAYSSETKLTIVIKVRYFNNVQPEKSLDNQTFSAYQTFDSNVMFNDVEAQLNEEIVKELVDHIYNATVGDW